MPADRTHPVCDEESTTQFRKASPTLLQSGGQGAVKLSAVDLFDAVEKDNSGTIDKKGTLARTRARGTSR